MAANGLEKYLPGAEQLLEQYSAQDLAALLLKTLAKDPSDLVPVKITPERPLPQGKKSFGGGRRSNNRGGGGGRREGGRGRDDRRNRGDRDRNRDDKDNRRSSSKGSYNKDGGSRKPSRRPSDKKRSFVIRNNQD